MPSTDPLADAFEAWLSALAPGEGEGRASARAALESSTVSMTATDGAARRPADRALPAARISNFRLLRRIGAGGTSEVILAEQEPIGRLVALKLLRDEDAGLGRRRRFVQEARAAARLRHPNAVVVLDAGESDGFAFVAMEHVPGCGLDEAIAAACASGIPLPAARCVAWAREVAAALSHAHEQGIVHRDVKPSNVRIHKDGYAVLLDFGLASELDETSEKGPATFCGSLPYAPPEVLRGGAADARSDVYALGATLYEALTGRLPFEGETPERLARAIQRGAPPPPRQLRRDLPAELEAVVMRALERRPEDRYLSAAEMGEDLAALAELRTVRARPGSLPRRALRWCLRNRATAILGAALVITAVSAATWSIGAEFNYRAVLAAERDSADAQRLAAQSSLSLPNAPGLALLLARESLHRTPTPLGRSALARALEENRELLTVDCADGPVRSVGFDARENLTLLSVAGSLCLFDVKTGFQLRRFEGPSARSADAQISPNGQCALVADRFGVLRSISTKDGSDAEIALPTTERASSCAMRADGAVAVGLRSGRVALLDASQQIVWIADAVPNEPITQISFDETGRRIAAACASGAVAIFATEQGLLERTLECGTSLRGAAASQSASTLVTLHSDGFVRSFDLETGEPKLASRRFSGAGVALALSHDGRLLAASAFDRSVRIWTLPELTEIAALRGHEGAVISLAWSNDDRRLATGGGDGDCTARLWSITPPAASLRFDRAGEPHSFVRVAPDGRSILVGGMRTPLALLDARSGAELRRFPNAEGVLDARFTGDGARLTSITTSGLIQQFEASSARLVFSNNSPRKPTLYPALSTDGRRAALVLPGPELRLIDLERGETRTVPLGNATVRGISWDASRESLLLGFDDGTLERRDPRSGAVLGSGQLGSPISQIRATAGGSAVPLLLVREDKKHLAFVDRESLQPIVEISLPPTARRLAAASPDGRFALVESGSEIVLLSRELEPRVAPFPGHESANLAAAFSPDSRYLAAGSGDGVVRIYDCTLRELWVSLELHKKSVRHLQWSDDGTTVISCSEDGTVRQWRPFEIEARAAATSPRELTARERARFGIPSRRR